MRIKTIDPNTGGSMTEKIGLYAPITGSETTLLLWASFFLVDALTNR